MSPRGVACACALASLLASSGCAFLLGIQGAEVGDPDAIGLDQPTLDHLDATFEDLNVARSVPFTPVFDPHHAAYVGTLPLNIGDAEMLASTSESNPKLELGSIKLSGSEISAPFSVPFDGMEIKAKVEAGGESTEYTVTMQRMATLVATRPGTIDQGRVGSAVAAAPQFLAYGAPQIGPGTVIVLRRDFSLGMLVLETLQVPSLAAAARFGASVSLSADLLAVGAPGADSVYLFRRNNVGVWQVIQSYTGTGSTAFGTAVAVQGNRVLVGAPDQLNGVLAKTGAVYVFAPDSGNVIDSTFGDNADDGFGAALALRGRTLVVGAPGSSSVVSAFFSVSPPIATTSYMRAFSVGDNGHLTLLGTATDPGGAGGFAASVDVAGDVVVAGKPTAATLLDTGTVYVYSLAAVSGSWMPVTMIAPPADGSTQGGEFGAALAVGGDVLLVGSPGAHPADGAPLSGAVFVYINHDGLWELHQTLAPPDGKNGDFFGIAVSMAGQITVGASGVGNVVHPGVGAGYLFE